MAHVRPHRLALCQLPLCHPLLRYGRVEEVDLVERRHDPVCREAEAAEQPASVELRGGELALHELVLALRRSPGR